MHTFKNSPSTVLGYRKDGRPIYPIAGGSESAPEVEATAPEVTTGSEESAYSTPVAKDNPAWDPFFQALPDSLHGQVRPVLSEWDRNVQSRIDSVHQEYASWKPFLENQVDPDTAAYALQVLDSINERPLDFISAVAQHFELDLNQLLTPQQQQQMAQEQQFSVVGEQQQEVQVDPRFAQLEEGFQALAGYVLTQQQQEEAAATDKWLEDTLTYAKTKYGEGTFDETTVLNTMLQNGGDIDNAIEQYQALQDRILGQNNRPAPRVMGGGSGVPSQPVDASKMTEAERKAYIVQTLMNANNS